MSAAPAVVGQSDPIAEERAAAQPEATLLKTYVCKDHDGYWPVPTASVVVARDEDEARALLDAELMRRGLKPHAEVPYTLCLLTVDTAQVVVLSDGDY